MQSADEACTFVPSGRIPTVEDVGGRQARSLTVRSSETCCGGSGGAPSAAETAEIQPRQATMNAMILMVPAYPPRVDIW